jgi:hypothetical protein
MTTLSRELRNVIVQRVGGFCRADLLQSAAHGRLPNATTKIRSARLKIHRKTTLDSAVRELL